MYTGMYPDMFVSMYIIYNIETERTFLLILKCHLSDTINPHKLLLFLLSQQSKLTKLPSE